MVSRAHIWPAVLPGVPNGRGVGGGCWTMGVEGPIPETRSPAKSPQSA